MLEHDMTRSIREGAQWVGWKVCGGGGREPSVTGCEEEQRVLGASAMEREEGDEGWKEEAEEI